MVTGSVRDRTIEFLLKFADKGRLVISNAIEITEENENLELGDFSYKALVERLQSKGFYFDPKMILRRLEKEYGIIETSYKSTNQHWWRFIDKDQVLEVVKDQEEVEDPKIRLIFLKFYSLDPKEIEKKLEFINRKVKLSDVDKKMFRTLIFDQISQLTELYEDALQYEETQEVAKRIQKILTLAYTIGRKIYVSREGINKGLSEKEGERENNYAYSLRLPNGKNNVNDES